jgi:cell division protein FtsB
MGRKVKPKNLRQQVAIEKKRRNMLFFTVVILASIYMGITFLLGEMGLGKYLELRENEKRLELEIGAMEREKELMKAEADALKRDPFYVEKHAREEYGLAKPDEFIFQFKDNGR